MNFFDWLFGHKENKDWQPACQPSTQENTIQTPPVKIEHSPISVKIEPPIPSAENIHPVPETTLPEPILPVIVSPDSVHVVDTSVIPIDTRTPEELKIIQHDLDRQLQAERKKRERQAEIDSAFQSLGQFFVNKYLHQMETTSVQQAVRNMRKQGIPITVTLKIQRLKEHIDEQNSTPPVI